MREFKMDEDYWHPRLKSRECSLEEYKKYYFLDFSPKGHYSFKLNNGIPIVEMDGVETEFSITIFNYGLGLIDLYHQGHKNIEKILNVLKWTIKNQEEDGAWRNYYKVDYLKLDEGWSSAMGQGLGISFVCRCYHAGLLSFEETTLCVEKAKKHMLSDKLVTTSKYGDILEEFGSTNAGVLNGFIFALYGLKDYGILLNDFSLFDKFTTTLHNIIHRYNLLFFWSYYSYSRIFSSSFYHQLHIDMMNSLYGLTGDKLFYNCAKRWEKGKKTNVFFVLLKATQKMIMFNSVGTLNT